MKYIFYDLETTGTDPRIHGIHQISGFIRIGQQIVEEFNFKVQPFTGAAIDPGALAVANVTVNDLAGYEPMHSVFLKVIDMLNRHVGKFNPKDKLHTVGYNNAAFDNPFFRQWFICNGDNYFGSWFWSAPIDVMVLAADHLRDQRHKMTDFKLKTVAAFLGIPVDLSRLHDAAYDIILTDEIYNVIQNERAAIREPAVQIA